MQKFLLAGLLFLLPFSASSQIQIDWLNITDEEVDARTNELYATNSGHCPLTVTFDFKELTNFKSTKKLPVVIVVPNDGKPHLR